MGLLDKFSALLMGKETMSEEKLGESNVVLNTKVEQRFYSEADDLFKEGALKEIFKHDEITICNVGNAFYVAFLFGENCSDEEINFIIIPAEQLECILKDNTCLYELFSLRDESLKGVYRFDDRAKSTIRNAYKKTQEEGARVDLKFEAELLKKYQHRNELHNR